MNKCVLIQKSLSENATSRVQERFLSYNSLHNRSTRFRSEFFLNIRSRELRRSFTAIVHFWFVRPDLSIFKKFEKKLKLFVCPTLRRPTIFRNVEKSIGASVRLTWTYCSGDYLCSVSLASAISSACNKSRISSRYSQKQRSKSFVLYGRQVALSQLILCSVCIGWTAMSLVLSVESRHLLCSFIRVHRFWLVSAGTPNNLSGRWLLP